MTDYTEWHFLICGLIILREMFFLSKNYLATNPTVTYVHTTLTLLRLKTTTHFGGGGNFVLKFSSKFS